MSLLRNTTLTAGLLVACFVCDTASSQTSEDLQAQLRRIFDGDEFLPKVFGPARWLEDGAAYTTLEPSKTIEDAVDIVRYATKTGRREILVSAEQRIPPGASGPLEVSDYQWSGNREYLLIFTNTVRVWRQNTRGDYWVLDLASGQLRKLGGVAPPSSLMFAKFSPDATRVAYVVDSDLYVEHLSTGEVTPLTSDGSATTINGTSDWVYEEEFGLRDAFRWSPDGKRVAFWNFDAHRAGRVHTHQQHRRALSKPDAYSLSQGGYDQLRGPDRDRGSKRRRDYLAGCPRRRAQHLHRVDGMGR